MTRLVVGDRGGRESAVSVPPMLHVLMRASRYLTRLLCRAPWYWSTTNSKIFAERQSARPQLNVEYNQLDPLLREADGGGDVNDPDTGFSPYPGNINQLVFALDPYSKVCSRGSGYSVCLNHGGTAVCVYLWRPLESRDKRRPFVTCRTSRRSTRRLVPSTPVGNLGRRGPMTCTSLQPARPARGCSLHAKNLLQQYSAYVAQVVSWSMLRGGGIGVALGKNVRARISCLGWIHLRDGANRGRTFVKYHQAPCRYHRDFHQKTTTCEEQPFQTTRLDQRRTSYATPGMEFRSLESTPVAPATPPSIFSFRGDHCASALSSS